MALLRWLHRKIWPQKPKIAPKKSVFWVNWPKNNILRSGYPNFFFYFANIRCLEVPKKISGHISKKWLRYDHLKRRGKNGKRRKWSFFVIFLAKNPKTQKSKVWRTDQPTDGWTDWRTDLPTDTARCRVACPRLKNHQRTKKVKCDGRTNGWTNR